MLEIIGTVVSGVGNELGLLVDDGIVTKRGFDWADTLPAASYAVTV